MPSPSTAHTWLISRVLGFFLLFFVVFKPSPSWSKDLETQEILAAWSELERQAETPKWQKPTGALTAVSQRVQDFVNARYRKIVSELSADSEIVNFLQTRERALFLGLQAAAHAQLDKHRVAAQICALLHADIRTVAPSGVQMQRLLNVCLRSMLLSRAQWGGRVSVGQLTGGLPFALKPESMLQASAALQTLWVLSRYGEFASPGRHSAQDAGMIAVAPFDEPLALLAFGALAAREGQHLHAQSHLVKAEQLFSEQLPATPQERARQGLGLALTQFLRAEVYDRTQKSQQDGSTLRLKSLENALNAIRSLQARGGATGKRGAQKIFDMVQELCQRIVDAGFQGTGLSIQIYNSLSDAQTLLRSALQEADTGSRNTLRHHLLRLQLLSEAMSLGVSRVPQTLQSEGPDPLILSVSGLIGQYTKDLKEVSALAKGSLSEESGEWSHAVDSLQRMAGRYRKLSPEVSALFEGIRGLDFVAQQISWLRENQSYFAPIWQPNWPMMSSLRLFMRWSVRLLFKKLEQLSEVEKRWLISRSLAAEVQERALEEHHLRFTRNREIWYGLLTADSWNLSDSLAKETERLLQSVHHLEQNLRAMGTDVSEGGRDSVAVANHLMRQGGVVVEFARFSLLSSRLAVQSLRESHELFESPLGGGSLRIDSLTRLESEEIALSIEQILRLQREIVRQAFSEETRRWNAFAEMDAPLQDIEQRYADLKRDLSRLLAIGHESLSSLITEAIAAESRQTLRLVMLAQNQDATRLSEISEQINWLTSRVGILERNQGR